MSHLISEFFTLVLGKALELYRKVETGEGGYHARHGGDGGF